MASVKQSNNQINEVDFTNEELDQLLDDPNSNIKLASRVEYKGIF
jgi:hypothetical protein